MHAGTTRRRDIAPEELNMTHHEQHMQEMSDAELEITGSGNDDFGYALGGWLHYQWNRLSTFCADLTNEYGPEIWNTAVS